MLDVGGATQIILFHDEEHIPPKPLAHEADEARGQIRIAIDARRIGQRFDDPAKP